MKACLPSKPMYCSREYQASTRLNQQYEKSSSNWLRAVYCNNLCDWLNYFYTSFLLVPNSILCHIAILSTYIEIQIDTDIVIFSYNDSIVKHNLADMLGCRAVALPSIEKIKKKIDCITCFEWKTWNNAKYGSALNFNTVLFEFWESDQNFPKNVTYWQRKLNNTWENLDVNRNIRSLKVYQIDHSFWIWHRWQLLGICIFKVVSLEWDEAAHFILDERSSSAIARNRFTQPSWGLHNSAGTLHTCTGPLHMTWGRNELDVLTVSKIVTILLCYCNISILVLPCGVLAQTINMHNNTMRMVMHPALDMLLHIHSLGDCPTGLSACINQWHGLNMHGYPKAMSMALYSCI